MTEDDKKIAESIRSGRYFKEARSWYQAVYIGPVSERSFFLIIAGLAMLTGILGLFAFLSLMPLTTRPAIPIEAHARKDEVLQKIMKLKEEKETADDAMLRFFITHYVTAYEGYSAQTYQTNAQFIRGQSTDAVYTAYSNRFSVTNPRSPAAILGENGQRVIAPESFTTSESNNPGRSTVEFTAEAVADGQSNKTRWTTKLEYIYTGMEVKTVKNPETGKQELQVTDPKFQVTSYELAQDH